MLGCAISDEKKNKQTNKLRGLSPRANYTDRAKAACRRSWCQRFADRGCRVVSARDLCGHTVGFLDRSRYFFLPSSSSIVLTRLSGPHYF
jgi:hypothetical protein